MRLRTEGFVPRETWDGRLVYAKNGKLGIFARSLTGDVAANSEQKLVDDYFPPSPPIQVFPDGLYYGSPYYLNGVVRGEHLKFYSFSERRPLDLGPLSVAGSFTVSPDRRRLVYDGPITDGVDLSLIEMHAVR